MKKITDLVSDAAKAEMIFSLDELEEYANKHRQEILSSLINKAKSQKEAKNG